MLKINSKYSFLVVAFLLLNAELLAQTKKAENLPNFDRRKFHFGFVIGFNSANMEMQRSGPTNPQDSLHVITVVPQGGFNLGIVSSFSLGERLKL